MRKILGLLLLCILCFSPLQAQQTDFDEDRLGAWYMYFYNKKFGDSRWGVQGDAQFRNWNLGGDLEQLLLRSGLTYNPEGTNALLTLGYASITTGTMGDSDATSHENRVYQEALLPHRVSNRLRLNHRFRYEQRWVENQDFRTRYRYNLFVNVLLNADDFGKGTYYVAFYNELFINGQRGIGDGRSVELFDRNRTYGGLGYGITDGLRVQLGVMHQLTDVWGKDQLQVSLHHSW